MSDAPALTRRAVLTAFALLLVSNAGRGQAIASHRIGTLSGGPPTEHWEVFRQALTKLGYGERELSIESRWAEGHNERLPRLAAELVQLNPEVIVTGGSAAAVAAKQATSTIPIVTVFTADPIGAGLAASIPRPSGNVTGLANIQEDTVGKELELLETAVPRAGRIAVLTNSSNPSHPEEWRGAQEAAHTLHIDLLSVSAEAPGEIDSAFATMTGGRADALVVLADPMFATEASRVADLATRHKLPAIFALREHVAAGGLMSYGPDIDDSFRRAADYVDKILKGAKPADLPFEQPVKFELVINLKTAKALGLTIPPAILARADEVIE
jgi:putative ABC transport system substrate-binding protein